MPMIVIIRKLSIKLFMQRKFKTIIISYVWAIITWNRTKEMQMEHIQLNLKILCQIYYVRLVASNKYIFKHVIPYKWQRYPRITSQSKSRLETKRKDQKLKASPRLLCGTTLSKICTLPNPFETNRNRYIKQRAQNPLLPLQNSGETTHKRNYWSWEEGGDCKAITRKDREWGLTHFESAFVNP